MNARTQARYQARAKVIKALAHPTRLFIVDQIADTEKCVCELRDLIGADMSTVSKHLSVLKDAGVVSDDKRGLQVYYRLRVPCILNLFGCIEGVLRANAEAQADAMHSN
ncbi:MAG: helix-turn-helix transcriptional regulator [Candidatus Hydrogenedentes bacterium]|nr:helix-turn-helix transcriptional regulator [Candidatus Hydrogenedentota bacterium]